MYKRQVLATLLARTPGERLEVVLQRALPRAQGAYSLGFITRDSLVAARDELGIRPLCIGRLGDFDAPGGDGYIIASETCALDVVGARLVREVRPGEIVTIDKDGLCSTTFGVRRQPAMCSFEFIYFARPDSVLQDRSLYEARRAMGVRLAQEAPVSADLVIPLPDSGTPAAIGYAEESRLPFAEGMMKSRYINRTFLQPEQGLRDAGVRLKFNPMRHVLEGKRVILVDDSIVRGSTSRQIVEALRRAGAIARFAPLMEAVQEHAQAGGLVLGICNGFQVLCEAGMLPGALLRNASLQFRCQPACLRVETTQTPFLSGCQKGQVLQVPVSHGEGRFYADRETLAQLNAQGRVALRYCEADGALSWEANPNGSLENIAGILNERGNVLGMMPHPERACELLLGSDDGMQLFQSAIQHLAALPA